jgi:tRNA(fMet)-specific endonuclease VapC
MFMLDTDMCIYLINERDQALRRKFEENASSVCISSITYAELRFGVEHSARVEQNRSELQAFCLDLDILPFDAEAGARYGQIRQELVRRGQTIGANDLLIAAHASGAHATLVTNNEREFGRVHGLRIENWLAETGR